MPICKDCGNSFPNRIEIEGRVKYLHQRKKCLDCFPYEEGSFSGKPIIHEVDENGCHICTSHSTFSEGRYYQIRRNGKTVGLHRYIYEQHHNVKLKKEDFVRHKCDNSLCINPEHLEIGSHKENMQDMVERGRSLKGEKNPTSKITDKERVEIESLIGKMGHKEIGEIYGITRQRVSQIKVEMNKNK